MHGVAVGDNLDFSFGRVRGVGGGYSFDPLSIRDAEVGILNFDRAQLVHHGTKKEGFTDTQIRDGFVWWIEQPHEEPGKKKGWVARRSANIGMNLFRNDPLLEKAVLDAQLNPGVYEKSPDMANAVARYGSEGLIGEFRCAGIGIPSSGAAIDEGRVPEESGFRRPGPTWSRSFPGDPAVASDGQSHSDGMAASLAFLPLVAGWLLVGLGVVMMAAALLCRRRMAENDSIGCCSAFVCA